MPLRWGDQDAYGHVNNATMFRLLEEARIRAFILDEGGSGQSPIAALPASPSAQIWTLIGGQQIEYLRPVPYLRDPLRIELWLGHLGGASIDICYEVKSPAGVQPEVTYARALTTLVLVDADTGLPRRLDSELRALWEPYLEAPIAFRKRG